MGWLKDIKKVLDTETGAPSDKRAPPVVRPSPPPPAPPPWEDETLTDDVRMTSYPSPDAWLERMVRTIPNTIPLGIDLHGKLQVTSPDHHVLAIAPPRSAAGKTASIIIPAVVSHQGPVVVATTKPDVLPATAMARAQRGELWCYCPDGNTNDIPPGVRELRWSPMSGADDLDVAIRTARAMAATIRTDTVTSGDHWRKRAAQLLAAVFHWAALTGRTMHDARNRVYMGVGEDLEEVWRELRDRHAEDAAAMLQSILQSGHQEKNSIASTAAGALEGYQLSGALRSTENENFDAADFVNGGPLGMRADTVYITASSYDQGTVAPLVVGLLNQIQQAAYRRNRILATKGDITTADGQVFPFRLGGVGAVPALFALDELYGLAPLPNLPHVLSEGGSQGILIAAAVQELSMLKSRWREAQAFLTLFGHVLVFPGIRDPATLETVSTLLGNYDAEVTNVQSGPKERRPALPGDPYEPPEWEPKSRTTQTHRRRWYEPDEVARGPGGADDVFHFTAGGSTSLHTLPYWRSVPWPPILTAYLERAVSGRVPAWRYWEAERSGERPPVPDVLPGLPVPDLRSWARAAVTETTFHPVAREWGARYQRAVDERERLLSQGGEREATYDVPSDNADTWSVTRRDAVPPPRRRAQGRREPILPFEATWGPGDDAAMVALSADDPFPPRYVETQDLFDKAIAAEIARRQERGDDASADRFTHARLTLSTAIANDPALQARLLEERNDAMARGEDHGWWKWLAPPLMRLIQPFLRGEDITGACEEALAVVGIAPPVVAEPPPTGTPTPGQSRPEHPINLATGTPVAPDNPFWTLADDAAMAEIYPAPPTRANDTRGTRRWREAGDQVGAALEAESDRRRSAGDAASVDHYYRTMEALVTEWRENPAFLERARRQVAEAINRGENLGYWKWTPPEIANILRAYIRREDIGAGGAPEQREPPPAHEAIPEVSSGAQAGGWTPQRWSPEADERMRRRRPGGLAPACLADAMNELGPALERERQRRRQLGDSASVERFDREMAERSAAVSQDDWDRTWDGQAAQARGYVGFWGWIPPAFAELEQAFLRGEGMSPPRPERWEPDWSPDEDVTMRKWADKGGGAVPDCYQSNLKHMLDAIERERKRRRQIGDVASIELYDLRKDLILNACTDNEADLRRMRETARTRSPGFWAFLPGKLGQLNQAFLRGDHPEVKDAGETPVRKTSRW